MRKETAHSIVEALKNNKPLSISTIAARSLDALFEQIFAVHASRDPQMLSQLGLLDALGIKEHNKYINDSSPEALQEALEAKKACLQALNVYEVTTLSDEQRVSHAMLVWSLAHAVEGERFLFHEYTVNQMDGVLFALNALMTQFHRFETNEDAHNYLTRLDNIPQQLHNILAILDIQQKAGITTPHCALSKVVTILETYMPHDPTQHIFYTHVATQLQTNKIADTENLLATARELIATQVIPAYRMVHTRVTELLNNHTTNNGVWALPNGDAYYAHMLKFHTTTNLSAQEIHELGKQQVSDIQAQMRAIFNTIGMSDNTQEVGALMQQLAQQPQFYYPNTAEGRAHCLAEYNAILERSRTALAHLFDAQPKAGVNIRPVPEHAQEGSPAAYYYAPSMDGTRPGEFFANLRNMSELPTYGMETLTIHEAEPGHHFQLALQQEMDIPLMRKLGPFTAFIEGWALYAEKLAYEHNFYSSPYSKLGHLQDELMRAARLVIDTGIHAQRWSREQAIEYMVATLGCHRATAVTEVERYFVLPGQACAYKIGQLKILELRAKAQKALGNRFDIRLFHNVLLSTGAAPLDILEDVVDAYIADSYVNNKG